MYYTHLYKVRYGFESISTIHILQLLFICSEIVIEKLYILILSLKRHLFHSCSNVHKYFVEEKTIFYYNYYDL